MRECDGATGRRVHKQIVGCGLEPGGNNPIQVGAQNSDCDLHILSSASLPAVISPFGQLQAKMAGCLRLIKHFGDANRAPPAWRSEWDNIPYATTQYCRTQRRQNRNAFVGSERVFGEHQGAPGLLVRATVNEKNL